MTTNLHPWETEPSLETWTHEGFVCVVSRSNLRTLCGYVGVPPGHPWHSRHYDKIAAEVHGGLTYADERDERLLEPMPGTKEYWWVGFDGAHAGDLIPGPVGRPLFIDGTYRTIDYMKRECESLAEQASAARFPKVIIHILHYGLALCGQPGMPCDWPLGSKWVSLEDGASATCTACRDKSALALEYIRLMSERP